MSKNFTRQRPKSSGNDLAVGPKIMRNSWLPIRLMASVAIIPRDVKAGLSCSGMKTMQADDDAGDRPGDDARRCNDDRLQGWSMYCRHGDQPGGITGEGKDEAIGEVDQPEAGPGDRHGNRDQAIDRGDRDGIDEDERRYPSADRSPVP